MRKIKDIRQDIILVEAKITAERKKSNRDKVKIRKLQAEYSLFSNELSNSTDAEREPLDKKDDSIESFAEEQETKAESKRKKFEDEQTLAKNTAKSTEPNTK